MEPVFISHLVWIPYRYYTAADAARVISELSVVPAAYEGRKRNKIQYWVKDNDRRIVGVPVDYGLREIARLGIPSDSVVEDLAQGQEVTFPKKPSPRTDAQREFFESTISALQENYTVMATAPTGSGKCFGKGTPILLHNGDVIPVEKVKVGQHLIGPDSLPRVVTSLASGEEMLYKVTPVKGEPYIVNESHILSLKVTGGSKGYGEKGTILNVSVKDYLGFSSSKKHVLKGWRACVEYPERPLTCPPYILGLWLGDGNSRKAALTTSDNKCREAWATYAESLGYTVRKERAGGLSDTYHIVGNNYSNKFDQWLKFYDLILNKHIPITYLTSSRGQRLELLAGLMDSDGHLSGNGFDFIAKRMQLAKDVCQLARSLGFAAYMTQCQKGCQTGSVGIYYRVSISGDCSLIPTRLIRKQAECRSQVKDVLVTGIRVEPIGVGNYYGFTVEGPDRLFLLGDFTVVHNTVCVLNAIATLNKTALIIVDTLVIAGQWRDEITKHLGIPDAEIGTIQGSTVDYTGKRITVAVIHNLVQKAMPEPFYEYFGFVGWDECQILGAESFSTSMGLFHARYRITVTATPSRADGCFKMVTDHFGYPKVIANQTAMPCEVRVIRYNKWQFSALPAATLLNKLAVDEDRNRIIVSVILQEWHEGRPFLCVSDRIEHLQHLMSWCHSSGIPKEVMGLFTRSYTDENGVSRVNKKPYLDWCKRSAEVILATYGMFEKAVDVPRLSSGIDATPRSSAIQLIGRIRREFPGKPTPRWFTFKDAVVAKLASKFRSRLRDYESDPSITVIYL